MTIARFAFRAVCFDLDGTLVDSYAAIAASVNHVRSEHGLGPLTVAEVKRFVGRGAEQLLIKLVPGGQLNECLASYRAHHPAVMFEKTTLIAGAAEALCNLHERGLSLGLCSNKPRDFSVVLLRHLGISQYFSVVLGPEDVARPKPAPDMLIEAMRRLKASAEQTLYIGDMTVDIQTARSAGVTVWVVPSGSDDMATLEAAGPDRLLERLNDLTEQFSIG